MLFYPAALPLSRQTLDYTAGIIRRHRRQIGSCWRKPYAGRQAPLIPAYLRKGETFAELAAGFGIGTATAWRCVNETVVLLAARAPSCARRSAMPARPGTRLPGHRRHVNPDQPGRRRPAVLLRQAPQARLAECQRPTGGQPGACPAPRSRRTRQCPAQILAHPAQAPLLPVAGRATGQSHPRPSDPRDRRMKKAPCDLFRAQDAQKSRRSSLCVRSLNCGGCATAT